MDLPQAVVEEAARKVVSRISAKLDDKASEADTVAKIELALRRLDIVLEKTGEKPITRPSLLRSWNHLKGVYVEGIELLNKHKKPLELDGQVVVRSFSFFQRIANSAPKFSISSLVGRLGKEHLSPSAAQKFERNADWAENKFVTEVESSCPLRHDTFDFPFLRHLFEGKTVWYQRVKGRNVFGFYIWPVILEGRGVEAFLYYKYVDPDRLDKRFSLNLMLRISESTDIIGTAINCLRSTASLLNPVALDAAGQLTLLHNFQDISYSSSDPPFVGVARSCYPSCTKVFCSNPLCCQEANGHKASVNSITGTPSELSHIFPEQTILFRFKCYTPVLQYRKSVVGQRRPQHLELRYAFTPHFLPPLVLKENCKIGMMVNNKEENIRSSVHGNVLQTVEMLRSEAMNRLNHDPQMTNHDTLWFHKHGCVFFFVEKRSSDIETTTTTKASGRYKTRSATKRKR